MYKYDMLIDGESYSALFLNHIEGADFLDDCERDGDKITNLSFKEVGWQDALADDDFSWDYRIELVSDVLIPGYAKTHKVWEVERELEKLGYI